MKVLHVIPSIDLCNGGPSRSSVNLANSLAAQEDMQVYFYAYKNASNDSLTLSPSVKFHRQEHRHTIFAKAFYRDFCRIRALIFKKKIDIVHLHGVWHPLLHWASRAAYIQRVPYVIQPRGMVEPWALAHKRLKKLFAMKFYQNRDFNQASGFLATSNEEVASIRALGVSSRIEMIPNGVEQPDSTLSKALSNSSKVALFLSRVHPKKGVIDLVEAWSEISPKGWTLRIVGPDDGGHLKEVCHLIKLKKLESQIKVIGPAYDQKREYEYVNADLFILPTYSENFGIAIAEALSYGLPVITTTGAPWASIVESECGWWIEPGKNGLLSVLPEALGLSNEDRTRMGQRAKELASKFNWEKVASDTRNFYVEVLTRGD